MLPPWLHGAYATRRWHSFSLPAYHPAGGRAQDFALITGAVLWFSQQQKKKVEKKLTTLAMAGFCVATFSY
jgi:hypothetical protein